MVNEKAHSCLAPVHCTQLLPLLVWLLVPFVPAAAQGVAINADGADPDPAAVLDVKATDKGLLIPQVALPTNVWRPTNPPYPAASTTMPALFSPFDGHGLGAMENGLWVYNTTASPATVNIFPSYGTTPGFYWWNAAEARWIRQVEQVGRTYYAASAGSEVSAAANITLTNVLTNTANWVTVPGTSVTVDLLAGDRVQLKAQGALGLLATNAYAWGGARIVRTQGAVTTEIGRVGVALTGEQQPMYSGFCFLPPLFCSGNTPQGTYTTHFALQDWRILREYAPLVAEAGPCTFSLQICRVDGTGTIIGGGTGDLQSHLEVEVFRP